MTPEYFQVCPICGMANQPRGPCMLCGRLVCLGHLKNGVCSQCGGGKQLQDKIK